MHITLTISKKQLNLIISKLLEVNAHIKIKFGNKLQRFQSHVFLWFYMTQRIKLIYPILQIEDKKNNKKNLVQCIKELCI